jgi:hypothetical protein
MLGGKGKKKKKKPRERNKKKNEGMMEGKKTIPPPLRITRGGEKTLTRRLKPFLLERTWRASL